MLIVRNSFTAKPGQAGKLAELLKKMSATAGMRNPRVMTDLVGDFNHVVLEHETDSLGEFEEKFRSHSSDPEARALAKEYLDLWTEGRREIFQVA